MKVAIRDDDTCYFTAPDELERVYSDIWDRVPVCLAIVPVRLATNAAAFRASTGTREWRCRSILTPSWWIP